MRFMRSRPVTVLVLTTQNFARRKGLQSIKAIAKYPWNRITADSKLVDLSPHIEARLWW